MSAHFLARIERTDDGCWLYRGWTDRGGYAYTSVRGKKISAHRYSYALHIGPIPEGHELHHECENRRCVNPAHLRPVTRLEHARLGERATKTHCKRGHELTPENLVAGRQWRTCKTCHRERIRARRHGLVFV